jgi:hypothetical protein
MYDDRPSFHNWDIDAEAFTKIVGRLLDAGLAEADVRKLVSTSPARMRGIDDDVWPPGRAARRAGPAAWVAPRAIQRRRRGGS